MYCFMQVDIMSHKETHPHLCIVQPQPVGFALSGLSTKQRLPVISTKQRLPVRYVRVGGIKVKVGELVCWNRCYMRWLSLLRQTVLWRWAMFPPANGGGRRDSLCPGPCEVQTGTSLSAPPSDNHWDFGLQNPPFNGYLLPCSRHRVKLPW